MLGVRSPFCSIILDGELKPTPSLLVLRIRLTGRCFLYLFPGVQTWYLVLVLIAFVYVQLRSRCSVGCKLTYSVIEMIGYVVLNIGLPVLEEVGGGWQKFTNGLFQSLGVRASGLTIRPVANLAPATLYVVVEHHPSTCVQTD